MEFGRLVQDCHAYDWIVFTSPNGVDAFFEMFYKLYDDAREIGGVSIAAIGPATARRVKDFHLKVDLQPEEFVAEAVVREFKKDSSIENQRILLAKAEVTRDVLSRELTAMGAIVDEAIAYRTVAGDGRHRRGHSAFQRRGRRSRDLHKFVHGGEFRRTKTAAPSRHKDCEHRPCDFLHDARTGTGVDVEARQHDIPGLLHAIERFYK